MEKATDSEEKLQVRQSKLVSLTISVSMSLCVSMSLSVSIAMFLSADKDMAMDTDVCVWSNIHVDTDLYVQVLERLLQLDVHVSDLLLSPVGKVLSIQKVPVSPKHNI